MNPVGRTLDPFANILGIPGGVPCAMHVVATVLCSDWVRQGVDVYRGAAGV